MHRILLIRASEDALPMKRVLKAKGLEVSHYPLFKPQFFPIPPLKNPQSLIITSKNAIRALKESDTLKKIPLYTVGDKTAELAKEFGFSDVVSASGTSDHLIHMILAREPRNQGILWHLSGEDVKGNIIESLKCAGFDAKRHIIYRIEDATDIPSSLCTELESQAITHAIFCSPRTTSVFINLLKKQKLEKNACHIISLCLSEDIKRKALGLKWKEIWTSPHPNLNDLMGYFDEER